MNHVIRTAALLSVTSLLAACGGTTMLRLEAPAGRTLYGVTTTNQLVKFGSDNAARSLTTTSITGLAAGETLVGIDFEPGSATRTGGVLIGVGSSSRIYTINPATGAATAVSSASFAPGLSGTNFGVDFNPVPNRVRVHGSGGQNLRLNQETGAVVDFDANTPGIQADVMLAFKVGDTNFGKSPALVGTAYTNSVKGATTTTLYAIDAAQDVLVTVAPPNDGVVNTVGTLGVNTTESVGFDIVATANVAYAALTPSGSTTSGLYTIDLTTGKATLVAALGVELRGLAIAP